MFLGVEIAHKIMIQERGGVSNPTDEAVHKLVIQEITQTLEENTRGMILANENIPGNSIQETLKLASRALSEV